MGSLDIFVHQMEVSIQSDNQSNLQEMAQRFSCQEQQCQQYGDQLSKMCHSRVNFLDLFPTRKRIVYNFE